MYQLCVSPLLLVHGVKTDVPSLRHNGIEARLHGRFLVRKLLLIRRLIGRGAGLQSRRRELALYRANDFVETEFNYR